MPASEEVFHPLPFQRPPGPELHSTGAVPVVAVVSWPVVVVVTHSEGAANREIQIPQINFVPIHYLTTSETVVSSIPLVHPPEFVTLNPLNHHRFLYNRTIHDEKRRKRNIKIPHPVSLIRPVN